MHYKKTMEARQGFSKDVISDIVITINDHLESVYTHKSILVNSSLIRRVPSHFRAIHKEDLDPRFVSIGPLHHNKPHLIAMEDHKLRFLLRLLTEKSRGVHNDNRDETENINSAIKGERAAAAGLKRYCQSYLSDETVGVDSEQNRDSMMTRLVYAMKVMEVEARRCYSEKFNNISASEFVTMMLLDGCFIVQLLLFYERSEMEDIDDPLFNVRWMVPNLHRDLLLLENQLPFAILDKIFEITTASTDDSCSLLKLALKFFNRLVPDGTKASDKKCLFGVHPDNLLHLVRLSFVSSFIGKEKPCFRLRKRQKKPHNFRQTTVPPYGHNAEELKEAGARFMSRENHDLLDITHKHGVLEIPPLHVDDFVGHVLLNLIAYEQCDRFLEPYFTHYALFFCGLVRSAKDVCIMHDAGLLGHELRSDEDVVNLLKKLCQGVVSHECDSYLSETLTEFYKTLQFTKWSKWKKKWREDYFSNPWAFSSFLAACTLLLLTLIQTFFSVYSYVVPPS